jgi:hypothetical protein
LRHKAIEIFAEAVDGRPEDQLRLMVVQTTTQRAGRPCGHEPLHEWANCTERRNLARSAAEVQYGDMWLPTPSSKAVEGFRALVKAEIGLDLDEQAAHDAATKWLQLYFIKTYVYRNIRSKIDGK